MDIPIAHSFAGITHTLGRLSSISATSTVGFREVTIGKSRDDPDAKVVPNDLPDQWAISGAFESGALFSWTWLSLGQPLPSGQPSLVWEIVGTEGKIRVESDAPLTGVAPAIYPPTSIFLNGDRVDLSEQNAALSTTGRAWKAFAAGKEGTYATFEDALELYRLIEAVKRSKKEGKLIRVADIQ